MNKNPLLIKSAIKDRIPFIRSLTERLYNRYLSNHRFTKSSESGLTETISAFAMGSDYELNDNSNLNGLTQNFKFDQADISYSEFFSDKEWIALGMLLRAYKEVEEVDLLHLYNCLYSTEKNTATGYVISGRVYTLYCSTQLPVKVYIESFNDTSRRDEGILSSLSKNRPAIISPAIFSSPREGELLKIKIEFTSGSLEPCTLIEGCHKGLSLKYLSGGIGGIDKPLIPENLKIGEYSSRLVEFFSGSLVTPLSDDKLLSNLSRSLPAESEIFKDKVKTNTIGIYNQDGYLDKRNSI